MKKLSLIKAPMRRFASLALVSLVLAQSTAHASAPLCANVFADLTLSQLLTTQEARAAAKGLATSQRQSYAKWSQQMVVRVAQMRMRKAIEELCHSPAACTDVAVARVVEDAITDTFKRQEDLQLVWRRVRGYAMLTGVSVTIAMASQYTKGSLPESSRWIAEFVTIASSIALYKLGAPLWDSIGGWVNRGSFRLNHGKSFLRAQDDLSHLNQRYQVLQEKMTPFQQQESNRMLGLLNNVEAGVTSAIESIMSRDPSKGGIDRGSARLATLAIKLTRYFPEVEFNDIDLTRTVRLLFTEMLQDPVQRLEVYETTLDKIAQNDPRFQDPAIAKNYRKLIGQWTGLMPYRDSGL
ncbi:MAG: hypothetical protein KF681_08940 [Bdellovibrionaceae bacterium]|nr:hypothetical protein [Pseudobdellovibrionaceae bacterium]